MHVLFIPSWYPKSPTDVAGCFFREQAIHLSKENVTVGVLATRMRPLKTPKDFIFGRRHSRECSDEGVITWRATSANLTPRFPSLNTKRQGALLWKLYMAYVDTYGHPDIIHVQAAYPAGPGAAKIATKFSIPYVLTEHRSNYALGTASRSLLDISREVALGSSARFAVSKSLAELLSSLLRLPHDFFSVMPNAVDSRFFSDNPKQGCISEVFRFTHVSLLDQKKDVALAIRAFARAFEGRSEVRLTIAGDGPTLSRLRSIAAELNVCQQIEFTGMLSRDGVRELFNRSNAFVLPSSHEPFGVVLIEALASGLPLIATNSGGPADIVTEKCGILVEPNNLDQMAQAMIMMVQNAPQWNPKHLQNYARDRYSGAVIAKRWLDVYQSIMEKNTVRDQ